MQLSATAAEALNSRDAVLRFIKGALQVFYDAGTLTRVQYVDICKSILYKTMEQPYGSASWTPQHLRQQISQRIAECCHPTNASAVSFSPDVRPLQIGLEHEQQRQQHHYQLLPPPHAAAPPVPHRQLRQPSLASAPALAPLAALLMCEMEGTARRSLQESEECQRQCIAYVRGAAADAAARQALPMGAIHEQQVALRQLLARSTPQRAASASSVPVTARRGITPPRTPGGGAAGVAASSPVAAVLGSAQRRGAASRGAEAISKQEVVEYMRQILQPSYNAGLLPAEQFADIVREVSGALFREGIHQPGGWKDFVRSRIASIFSYL